MSNPKLAILYGEALFQIAKKQDPKDFFVKEIDAWVYFLAQSPQLQAFLSSPQFNFEEKKSFLTRHLGENFPKALLQFQLYLIRRGRFALISKIVQVFHQLVQEEKGEMVAEVTAPSPLQEESKRALIQKLESTYRKKITLNEKIDPSLIGGFVVMVNNQRLDGSLKGNLDRMQSYLMQAGG